MQNAIVPWAMLMILFCSSTAQASDCVTRAVDALESGSPAAALPALTRGDQKGDERCSFVLGIWSISGTGMPQDAAKGAQWLRRAAEEGLPIAQSNLGLLYANGLGVETDEAEAAQWYREAAEYGDALGQSALGRATFRGVGVPLDRIEGYAWTSLAAEQGSEKARVHLADMEEVMAPHEIELAREKVAEFRPKRRPRRRPPNHREALRRFGIHRKPTEYERMFGF